MAPHLPIALSNQRVAMVLTLSVCFTTQGCGQPKDNSLPKKTASVASAQSTTLPPDRLDPGELPEGTVSAFGLLLPRSFHVEREFDGVVYFIGQGGTEQVSNYIRKRVDARTIELGPGRTIFASVHLNDPTKNNNKPLRIEVGESPRGTEIILRDLTPAPKDPLLTEEERWKKAGMKPTGGLIDPDKAF